MGSAKFSGLDFVATLRIQSGSAGVQLWEPLCRAVPEPIKTSGLKWGVFDVSASLV